MNLKLSMLLAAAVFATAALVPSTSRADAERLLGSTRLAKVENDTDVIRFQKCRGVDYLSVKDRIGQGSHSRWIDLRGGERCVKAIGIIGDTELSLDQARVEVWGR